MTDQYCIVSVAGLVNVAINAGCDNSFALDKKKGGVPRKTKNRSVAPTGLNNIQHQAGSMPVNWRSLPKK